MRKALCLVLLFSSGAFLAACGDDVGASSGGSGGGGSGGTNGDGPPGSPPDGSFLNDAGMWICTTPLGIQVTCACADGKDNDGDGLIDLNDPDCMGQPWNNSEGVGPSGGCGTTQCTDCIDNDGDGKIDSADPECTGPLDNDESSYATGIPGDNMDPCKQDCFFDGNSGSGDDKCDWNLGCEPTADQRNGCRALDPGSSQCTMQTTMCTSVCGTLTPNGCDCFGCCTICNGTDCKDVRLVSTCSVANLDNPSLCPPCTKSTACNNPCDPCEYCIGHTPDPSCFTDGGVPPGSDGGVPTCPGNEVPCNPIDRNCPAGYYCLTGCCIPNIP